jgi:hypothetical protein
MVSFVNQPSGPAGTVPDARISARFSYWFEVKTSVNALNRGQLAGHLGHLDGSGDERLFVVTPDPVKPDVITALGDPRLVWTNFRALNDAIDRELADPGAETVSDRARFLLRELQALFEADSLLHHDDVVVVAARVAYSEYLAHGVYACQPNRSFRAGAARFGFYADGAVQPHVPLILHRVEAVTFTRDEAARRRALGGIEEDVADAIDALVATGTRTMGTDYGLFLLSRTDDPRTVRLDGPVINHTTTTSGRPWAWTMSQRYVQLSRLTKPGLKVTSGIDR